MQISTAELRSPATNAPLRSRQLFPNLMLRAVVERLGEVLAEAKDGDA